MILGIVGSEQAKFTAETEAKARQAIRDLISSYVADGVASGCCHLGGVDAYAEEIAKDLGLKFIACPPTTRSWESGYKPRNIKIATESDAVVCITVAALPASYRGMQFPSCYHCGTRDHVKSGGCWTTKYARKLGKPGLLVVV